ncbi:LacI family DNA-binding transcriptional regulator [Planctobacterium marinum]|uniref:Transcriptional regulator n=1 Tax=Planctobacterium marinum TaxID=1631968 RepID=A0AA48I2Y4_9ALTE|nr:transcriptional regulator [Planctobacterium marinum]
MPANKKALNLKEVSKILGVSTATVSNAFNRPDQLSESLRQRILKETAELGYHGPNLAARSLRKGKTDVVAVVLADTLSYSFSDPVASQFLQGVSEILSEQKRQLLLLSSRLASKEQSSAESLPDGFIFYGAPKGDAFERISRSGKPLIAVDFEKGTVPSLNINNRSAAKDVANHVIRDGNDRVAVVSLRLISSDRVCRLEKADLRDDCQEIIAFNRLQGYMDACKEKSAELPPHMVWHTPMNTPEMAEKAAYEALTITPRPNVILCMSDVLALGVLRVAQSLKIKVPEELRIVGFDDIPEASRTVPALTTVCQQSIEKGRMAAKALFEQNQQKNRLMETRLMVRQSSGD